MPAPNVLQALLAALNPKNSPIPTLPELAKGYDPARDNNASRKAAFGLLGPMGAVASDWLPVTSTVNALEDFKNADTWQGKLESGFGLMAPIKAYHASFTARNSVRTFSMASAAWASSQTRITIRSGATKARSL
jgi:hypothetical protein